MSTQSPQEVAEFNLEQRRAERQKKDSKAPVQQACLQCEAIFTPRRPHQKFCGSKCRQAFHAAGDGGIYAEISRVTMLKRGGVSMVLRFNAMDRDNALSLVKGLVVDLRAVKEASGD